MSTSHSVDLEALHAGGLSKKGKEDCYIVGKALSGVAIGATVSCTHQTVKKCSVCQIDQGSGHHFAWLVNTP